MNTNQRWFITGLLVSMGLWICIVWFVNAALAADSQPAREPMPVVNVPTTLTAHAGNLRGFMYVQVGQELLLVPVYTLPGDERVFRTGQ